MKFSKPVALLTITLILSSCGFDEEISNSEFSTFGIRHDKILSDYEKIATNTSPYNSNEYPDFSPVVAFSYSLDGSDNHNFIATGTLVKPNWILTAGHNFFVAEEQSSPALPSGISVLVGNDPNNPTTELSVEELVFHPTWLNQSNDFLNANDLCLVKLSSPITTIDVAKINSSRNEELASTSWYSGFGDYSQESGQNVDLLSKKHAIENILDRKNEGISSTNGGQNYTGGLLAFDFDSPSGDVNSLGDDFVASDEALIGDGNSEPTATEFEGTTVQGDSGGPLFLFVDGEWKLSGVLSGGASEPIINHNDSDYGDISVFIRVSTHIDWINSVIE